MYQNGKVWIGKSDSGKICINPSMANRHGLIAGATGTGKTVSLRVMAESFSDAGVPVFMADVKGDLGTMCRAGSASESVQKRIDAMDLAAEGYKFASYPVTFWDIYGEKGLPLRTTVSEMGPLLLSRILGLTEVQTDIMTVIFKIADDEGLLLLDTKDLRSMIQYVSTKAAEYSMVYGNMSKQSLAAIVRAVVALESEGGEMFFGEPAVELHDWMRQDSNGKGVISILDCQKLITNPGMYSTFMLWMMSELFESLPEVGDREKPKMVFFFDEAHMLFNSASKPLLEKIEQVVKLIRSKGVGIYFITQNPKDIPDGVLSQLGNKVQHALRAYTPAEQKGAKAAAAAFRENPAFDTYTVLQELGTGEALVSVLDEKGIPTVVEKCTILPPQSRLGTLDDSERDSEVKGTLLYSKYDRMVDRESAYELLTARVAKENEEKDAQKAAEDAEKQRLKDEAAAQKEAEKKALAEQKEAEKKAAAEQKQKEKEELAAQKAAEKEAEKKSNSRKRVAKSVATTTGGTIGREIGNAVGSSIGGSFGKKIGGNVGASLGRGILGSLFK